MARTGFRMAVRKGDDVYEMTGGFDSVHEGWVVEMVAAMREGLEANGFDVEANLDMSMKVPL